MKILMAVVALAMQVPYGTRIPYSSRLPAGSGVASGYLHYRTLTVDHTQAGASDSSDFPVLVTATLGSSVVQNSSCFDVVFAADSAGTTLYPWEIETCNQSTGVIVAWVKLPTVSHTSDTVLYVIYDNSAISTAQNTGSFTPANVWTASYTSVWHLRDGTTLSVADSLGAHNGTNNGATATSGQIDGGAAFNGSSQYVNDGVVVTSSLSALSVESWVLWSGTVNNFGSSVSVTRNDAGGAGTYVLGGGWDASTNKARFWVISGGTYGNSGDSTTVVADGAWHHLVGTYDGTNIRLYVDGAVQATSATFFGPLDHNSNNSIIGSNNGSGEWWNGKTDNVSISSSVARSADWITAEFNNQKSSSTFLAVGSQH